MANVAQELVKLQALESGLRALVAEGRRRTAEPVWTLGFRASDDERLYLRAAACFNDLSRSLKHMAWLAQFEEEAASLYQETVAAVEGAGATSSVTWPLAFRADWDVDYLGLEYELRQHLPGLLDCLVRLIDGLGKVIRQWAAGRPAAVPPRPSATVTALRPMPVIPLRLRLLAGCR